MSLIEKMRKARESSITIQGHRFTIRRPTHLEVVEISAKHGGMNLRNAAQFVVGWDLTELDLVPGGTSDPVPFDTDLFVEWLQDQPEAWPELMQAINGAYKAHSDKLGADRGN